MPALAGATSATLPPSSLRSSAREEAIVGVGVSSRSFFVIVVVVQAVRMCRRGGVAGNWEEGKSWNVKERQEAEARRGETHSGNLGEGGPEKGCGRAVFEGALSSP